MPTNTGPTPVPRWLPMAGLLLAVPLLAAPAPDKSAPEKWRSDPDRDARLQPLFAEFQALPPERQARLRALDRQLRELDPAQQERLVRVMGRYADWLAALPDADRAAVLAAPTPADRLALIRKTIDRQWYDRAPKAYRDRLDALPRGQRGAQIARWRQEEGDQQAVWQLKQALALEAPGNRANLQNLLGNAETKAFVDNLRPQLGPEERARLGRAEEEFADDRENWPDYGRVLVELADRHPLLPGPATGPATFNELPPAVRYYLIKKHPTLTLPAALRDKVGRWPDYAVAVTEHVRRAGGELPEQLGPCRPGDFNAATQSFLPRLRNQFRRQPAEQKRLDGASNRWPDYPRAMAELAREANIPIPGYTLPGPPKQWEKFRVRRGKWG